MLEEEYEPPKAWILAELLCMKSRGEAYIDYSDNKRAMCKNKREGRVEEGQGTSEVQKIVGRTWMALFHMVPRGFSVKSTVLVHVQHGVDFRR